MITRLPVRIPSGRLPARFRRAQTDPAGGEAPVGSDVETFPAPGRADGLGAAVVALVTGPTADRGSRSRQLAGIAGALARSGRAAGGTALLGGRWLADALLEVAPRIPVRELDTLRAHHDGLQGDLLADALITAAARATAAVGAAAGAAAAVEWVAPPAVLVSAPVQIAAETLAVAAIEVKLIAELHQVYGTVPAGSPGQRALAYVWAWTNRRGVDPLEPTAITQLVGGPARRTIRNRLAGRAARNLGTLGPLLTGAAIGSVTNSRETSRVGRAVMEDLRTRGAH